MAQRRIRKRQNMKNKRGNEYEGRRERVRGKVKILKQVRCRRNPTRKSTRGKFHVESQAKKEQDRCCQQKAEGERRRRTAGRELRKEEVESEELVATRDGCTDVARKVKNARPTQNESITSAGVQAA